MKIRRHRKIRRIALGLALAAAVVPASAAAHPLGVGSAGTSVVRPDDRAVRVSTPVSDVALVVRPDDRASRVTVPSSDVRLVTRPDDRAQRIGPPVEPTLVLRRDPGAGQPSVEPVAAPTSGGFDWGDALIGAGIAAAFLVAAFLAARTLRHAGRGAAVGA